MEWRGSLERAARLAHRHAATAVAQVHLIHRCRATRQGHAAASAGARCAALKNGVMYTATKLTIVTNTTYTIVVMSIYTICLYGNLHQAEYKQDNQNQ